MYQSTGVNNDLRSQSDAVFIFNAVLNSMAFLITGLLESNGQISDSIHFSLKVRILEEHVSFQDGSLLSPSCLPNQKFIEPPPPCFNRLDAVSTKLYAPYLIMCIQNFCSTMTASRYSRGLFRHDAL